MASVDIKADLDAQLKRFEERQLANAFMEREKMVAAARRMGIFWASICLLIAGVTVLLHIHLWRLHHAA